MKRNHVITLLALLVLVGTIAFIGSQTGVVDRVAKIADPTAQDAGETEKAAAEREDRQPGPAASGDSSDEETANAATALNTPTFDIVRVEPTGDAVIAGQAVPNAVVKVENNGVVIAETTADATGAFVVLPNEPFKGETNEVTLRAVSETGEEHVSEQVVAIGVTGTTTPLVAIVEPGRPVNIVQRPNVDPEETASTASAAAVDSTPAKRVESTATRAAETGDQKDLAANAPDTDPVAEQNVEEPASETVIAGTDTTTQTAQSGSQQGISSQQSDNVAAVNPDTGANAGSPAAADEALANEQSTVSAPAVEQDTTTESTSDTTQAAAATEQQTQRTAQQEPVAPATLVQPDADVEVSVEAIETEEEKIFVAGSSTPGETVRVYVGDEFVGDAKTGADGRWLLEETKPLEPGEYNVRVDQLKTTGQVEARAEVPFVVSETEPTRLRPLDPTLGRRVIIRKNDNLWTISQRLYGSGERFTAIYTRNRDQIRNPNLIFPGQVFELPDDEALAPLQGPPSVE
ncbi:MAG: LysM peptidoglycan-binding domain-containing protein [Pseudomonadota bacterium]